LSRAAPRALVALAAFFVARPATAALAVYWSCYLTTDVDCVKLKGSLTSDVPFIDLVSERSKADVVVSVTNVPDEDGARYKLDFVGKRIDGYAIEVHTTDRIPSSVDTDTAVLRLMTKLERGLDDFMDQKDPGEVKNGALVLKLFDPARLPYAGRPQQSSVKWFVAPSVAANFSDVVGVGINAWGNAQLLFNYSERKWRLQQWIGASYTQQSQPVPGTGETASIEFAGASANNDLSWTFTRDRRWSVALLLAAEKNPQANYRFRTNGSVGLEFDFVPRETVNAKNVGFRCAIGPEFQRYDVTNIEGIEQQIVGRQFCDVFLSWHFRPIDILGSLGETTLLHDWSYRAFSLSLSATWRITDDLTLAPWVTLQQINQAINQSQTTTTAFTDPKQEIEASMLAAVQQGYTAPFGIQSGLTLRYLFGNGTLDSEDQRWRNVSNLR